MEATLYAFYLHGYRAAAQGGETRTLARRAVALAPTGRDGLRWFLAASYGAADGRVGAPRASRDALKGRIARALVALVASRRRRSARDAA